MTNQNDKERALKVIADIYSIHGFISQKDSWTRQLSAQELNIRRKEREEALIKVVLNYRDDIIKEEKEKLNEKAN